MYQPSVPGPGSLEPARARVEVGHWILVALPLVLSLAMFIFAPGYFRPLFLSTVGWWLLVLVVVLEAAAVVALRWGTRRFRRSPLKLQLFTMLVMVGLIFPSLWIIFLGPAVLIVMRAKSGG